jgi:hypothetical protein
MFVRVAVAQVLLATAASALAADVAIRGRLLDEADGAPVVGVSVKAYAPALGPNLWNAQGEFFSSFTDAQGRFTINVPGNELQFWVLAEGSGGSAVRSIISGESGEVELRIKRELPTGKLAGRILDQDGTPVNDLEFELVGELEVRRRTRTDKNGSFQLTELPSFGQGVLLASSKSTVLPQMIVRATGELRLDLRLVQGATLRGKIVENSSRLPVAGIKVSVRPGCRNWKRS